MAHADRYINNRTDRRVFRMLRALILYHQAPGDAEPTERAPIVQPVPSAEPPEDCSQLDDSERDCIEQNIDPFLWCGPCKQWDTWSAAQHAERSAAQCK